MNKADKMSGEASRETETPTLGELLESGFLRCYLCKKVYTDPRLLPCLHTFCKECIDKVVEIENQSENSGFQSKNNIDCDSKSEGDSEDGKLVESRTSSETNGAKVNRTRNKTIICPICKAEISIGNIKHAEFPENTFMKDLCLMYEYKHEKSRQCDYCRYDGKVVPATHLCLDCHDNMCQSCTGAHHRTKVTRLHKVVPYEQARKGLNDIDIRQYQIQTCPTHKEEPMSMFCERCEVLICKECKVSSHDNHKWCDTEKAKLRYEVQMKNLLKGIQNQIPTIHNYLQFLSNYDASIVRNREKTIGDIKSHTEKLHKFIDEQKAQYLVTLNEETDKERCEIQVRSSNLKTAAQSLENNEDFLRFLLEHGKPDEMLSLHRPINKRLTELTHMHMDGLKTRLKANFQLGNSSERNLQTIFGRLQISRDDFTHSDSGLASQSALQISTMLPNVKNCPELVHELDAKGMYDNKEVWPTGITVTKNGEIVIVDRDNKAVKVFDRGGKLKQEIAGQGENKLATPFDVVALKSGEIAITDHEAENVKIFTMKGDHVLTITEGIEYPRGITVNSKGQIIILDCQLRHITVHDPKTGNLIRTIGGNDGKKNKALVDPFYVTVTPQDNIIVTDTASPHLKFFGPTGEYLTTYGQYGIGKNEILQPYGVCCDEYGYIFIADNQNHRIHVLLPDGMFSQFLITKADNCWHPMGLAISDKGELVVTEALGKVKVYKYL
ncbi:E3 ubiquitin-protein ligase TRIM71-like [Mya arenaria]|uniref:E3 ubiquitin-protein ligase TRIM71-like n=1 Tax=Mya arenaria TaxID=6604 RepID=UPI0022E21ABF|nr:E3 ubiquitin-protein ligase TRIM71-like [Mya arenaria]